MPTNDAENQVYNKFHLQAEQANVYWLYYLSKRELYFVKKTVEFKDKFTKSIKRLFA